jgi:cephalosporin hydroxylase
MIQANYKRVCENWSDIYEHLPTLRSYATQCSSVAEMGVRSVVSTWAFLKGLQDAGQPASLLCLDIDDVPEIPDIAHMVARYDISMSFVKGDSATTRIEPVDLLFIDTWHVYGHLKRELTLHCDSVKKYIIMHDTTLNGEIGESVLSGWDIADQAAKSGYPESEIRMGLGPAVREFLELHPEWTVKEVFTNNNGLTVLQRA